MSRLTKKIASLLALVLAGSAIAALPPAAPRATAEDITVMLSQSAAASAQQQLLGQLLASDTALLYLGIDNDGAGRRIRANLAAFSQIFNDLLYGDANLAAKKSKAIATALGKVKGAWPLFSAAINAALARKRITEEQLKSIAGLSEVLFDATGEARAAYDAAVPRRFHSQLGIATLAAERQIPLSQKMIKEYLLIAANQELQKNRSLLAASFGGFDKALKGLINGDPDLRLISVADPRIQTQLAKVERVWSAILPMLRPAAKDGVPDKKTVIRTLNLHRQLKREAMAAAEIYRKL